MRVLGPAEAGGAGADHAVGFREPDWSRNQSSGYWLMTSLCQVQAVSAAVVVSIPSAEFSDVSGAEAVPSHELPTMT
jgi:hypothetical protein